MRRTLTASLLLYGTIAALAILVLFTIIIPAITHLGDTLQAGLARI